VKRIIFIILAGILVVSLGACSGKPVRPNQTSRQNMSQSRSQGLTSYQRNTSMRNPASYSYQTRPFRRTGPLFGFNLKKFFGSFRFNVNEAISDNFAALIVVFAVLLVIGFVIFQNRRSVRKGSYR
jgi:ABC-type transport system involved in multi-copper enzyme maturation permease subunit